MRDIVIGPFNDSVEETAARRGIGVQRDVATRGLLLCGIAISALAVRNRPTEWIVAGACLLVAVWMLFLIRHAVRRSAEFDARARILRASEGGLTTPERLIPWSEFTAVREVGEAVLLSHPEGDLRLPWIAFATPDGPKALLAWARGGG